MAEHLRTGHDEDVAAALYAGTFLVMGMGFFANSMHAHRAGLYHSGLTPRQTRNLALRNTIGQGGYVLALGVAWLSPAASLILCAVVALYYVFPNRAFPAGV
jgi:hypothetical protein